jgi:hypothetical protein
MEWQRFRVCSTWLRFRRFADCSFTDEGNGQQYRLSVFFNTGYRPYEDGPPLDEGADRKPLRNHDRQKQEQPAKTGHSTKTERLNPQRHPHASFEDSIDK